MDININNKICSVNINTIKLIQIINIHILWTSTHASFTSAIYVTLKKKTSVFLFSIYRIHVNENELHLKVQIYDLFKS